MATEPGAKDSTKHAERKELQRLANESLRELNLLERGGHRASLTFTPTNALGLIGQLQLALHHPHNDGPTADHARGIIIMLTTIFNHSPATLRLIDRGCTEGLEQ